MDDRVSFDVAYRRFVALENPSDVRDTNDRAFQDKLQQAMQFLRQCIKQRQLDGVLSENESFFELQNSQLYAFCLEYFLAMLIPKLTFFQESEPLPAAMQQQRQSGTESTNDQERNVLLRIRFLREADVFHTQFLDRAEQMRILTEKKRREQYERMESKKFSLSRDEKIERFKMQRDLEKKLAAVQERKKQLKGEEDDDLEDIEREQLMTFIQLGVIKSMDEQASINQERDMLETMVKMNQSSDKRDLFTDAHRPPPPQQGQGISVTHINPQFEMRRETIRSEVFQPGHRLPTMSLEEYADREVADAMERQKREAEAPQAPRRYEQLLEEGEEDNHGLVDEATYKDRAWDDWKDANPRGIGNKKGSQF
ncbi:hypothetical protein Poli38472_009399 [Pythium oligandrum]|uniref:TAP42-like protein n=1 Tax=Pythium oligandrum TaxID=41045 RepID=A0A8K1CMS9_PYTOL|nr:hypothetical protein Poli38472_009399 [Pythium oligandrum]|eukprot:TMW65232.1 hypothetical protein Poli38472_009399 [Pythium oligandrum]